jgi:Domain of unknown function (DUF4296)
MAMKKTALIIISALVLAACGGPEKPEKLLEKGQMENIMYDISLLQAIRSFAPQKLTDNNVDASTYIFKKYKIDSLTLAQNQMYYAQDLKTYSEMQKSVSERLKAAREKATGKKVQDKPVPAPVEIAPVVNSQNVTSAGARHHDVEAVAPLNQQQKDALKRRRDSIRAVAKQRLSQAPLNKTKKQ